MNRVNSKAAFFILKEAAAHVTDGGKIITIVTALLGAFTGSYTSYAGSKASVEHFTRGVSKELQGRCVSVNNIAPGPMDTRMLFLLPQSLSSAHGTLLINIAFFYAQETPESVSFLKANGMGNRLTEVTDIAPIVRFLCTEGSWISGQTLFANGGFTTR